jgi:hypothetical protein
MWIPGLQTGGIGRRHFLKHMAGFSLMAAPSLSFVQGLAASQNKLKKENKSLIILWMSGGPSHMDTWDMKPGESTGGQFKPIKTSANGIQISEHLPNVAKQMKHLSVIRSLVTNEGSHERGRSLMHTAYPPNPAITFPSIGAVTAQQIGMKELAIPAFISVSGASEGPGFLGMSYAPFTVQNPGVPPQNISLPGDLGADNRIREVRSDFRRQYLARVENTFTSQNRGAAAQAHTDIYKKAFDLTYSQLKNVFDLKVDGGKAMDQRTLDLYGTDNFGRGCLLARKLVEAGVSCVEVDLGGWDNHNNIFNALHNTGMNNRGGAGGLLDRLDKGMAALVQDLVDRGLWKTTTVVWMGEFGRTPRINQNGGRDHWARCWSVVVGGGGIKGGLVHGSTDKDGTSVKDDPCTVGDLFATLYASLGVNHDTEIRDPLGRPRKISGEKAGKPISSLL